MGSSRKGTVTARKVVRACNLFFPAEVLQTTPNYGRKIFSGLQGWKGQGIGSFIKSSELNGETGFYELWRDTVTNSVG